MSERDEAKTKRSPVMETLVAYGRGAAGAMLVGLHMVYTMEMWWAAYYMPRTRIVLLMAVNMGILLVLQHFSGLHPRKTPAAQVRAAIVAYGIGAVMAAAGLYGLRVLDLHSPLQTIAASIALEGVPLSVGASVAMSEFGNDHDHVEHRKESAGYFGSLGMGLGGAMVFGFAVSATEEPMQLGLQTHAVHVIAIVIASLLIVHLIVHAVEFKKRGKHHDQGTRWWLLIARDGVSAYAMAFLMAAYLLWTFGYIDGSTGFTPALHMTVVLSLLTSIGTAAGELLI
jgi:putative integral membrane protein (TIGR02587 family)